MCFIIGFHLYEAGPNKSVSQNETIIGMWISRRNLLFW
jgi:hypothetical protein